MGSLRARCRRDRGTRRARQALQTRVDNGVNVVACALCVLVASWGAEFLLFFFELAAQIASRTPARTIKGRRSTTVASPTHASRGALLTPQDAHAAKARHSHRLSPVLFSLFFLSLLPAPPPSLCAAKRADRRNGVATNVSRHCCWRAAESARARSLSLRALGAFCRAAARAASLRSRCVRRTRAPGRTPKQVATMASSGVKLSSDDFRRRKELDEARKAGLAPAEVRRVCGVGACLCLQRAGWADCRAPRFV